MDTKKIECSIIIPAFNEGTVIERCLKNLLSGLDGSRCEVIVVANGCKDDTVERAARFDGVKVVDLKPASKVAALNTGDEIALGDIRAYIDADILFNGLALMQVLDYMKKHSYIKVAAPAINFDLSNSSISVKAFYKIWQSLPYLKDQGLVGSGVYILSKDGRKSFSLFPNIISDDGYIRAIFSKSERVAVRTCCFTVFPPHNLSSLIKIKTRVRLGNMELREKVSGLKVGGENNLSSILQLLLSRPWLVLPCIVYFYVQYLTKYKARIRFRERHFNKWDRDNSSRISNSPSLPFTAETKSSEGI